MPPHPSPRPATPRRLGVRRRHLVPLLVGALLAALVAGAVVAGPAMAAESRGDGTLIALALAIGFIVLNPVFQLRAWVRTHDRAAARREHAREQARE